MSRFLIAAALSTLAVPALANSAERRFTQDGVTFTYTVTATPTGRVIEGRSSTGRDFRFVVEKGRVDGHVDNRRVSFAEPKPKRAEQLAQR